MRTQTEADIARLIRAQPREPVRNQDLADKAVSSEKMYLPLGTLWSQPSCGALSSITAAQYDLYITRVVVPVDCTLTGVRYQVGGTANGQARPSLYDSSGNLLAQQTSGVLQSVAGALGVQDLPWTSTVTAAAGIYFAGVQFNSASSTFIGTGFYMGADLDTSPTNMAAPSSITPTTAARGSHPILFLY